MTSLTIRTTQTETAEDEAIALAAMTSEDAVTVLTDSQAACRSYLRGRISKTIPRILETKGQLPETKIAWVPGLISLAGNEAAHAAARAHVHRAIIFEGQTSPAAPKTGTLVEYADI